MIIKEYRVVNNCTCDEYQVKGIEITEAKSGLFGLKLVTFEKLGGGK
jgi:hypothetical protein